MFVQYADIFAINEMIYGNLKKRKMSRYKSYLAFYWDFHFFLIILPINLFYHLIQFKWSKLKLSLNYNEVVNITYLSPVSLNLLGNYSVKHIVANIYKIFCSNQNIWWTKTRNVQSIVQLFFMREFQNYKRKTNCITLYCRRRENSQDSAVEPKRWQPISAARYFWRHPRGTDTGMSLLQSLAIPQICPFLIERLIWVNTFFRTWP